MNERAPRGERRSETSGRCLSERSTGPRPAPRLVLEITYEGKGQPRIVADSHEDELRLREWLRKALRRRESLSEALEAWLDELDQREAA